MRKFIVTILIALVIAIVCVSVFTIYSVSKLTNGNAVIKTYSYAGDVDKFIYHVRSFSSKNANIIAVITDTTGNLRNGYVYYVNIEFKNYQRDIDMLYTVSCNNVKKSISSETVIKLIMAYDKINNVGGYNRKANGVNPLVNYFDDNFIKSLIKDENVVIKVLS